MKKAVLVTGGAGFIGSNLVCRLLDENYKVVIIDNLSNGTKVNLSSDVEFFNIDISDKRSLSVLPIYKYHCIFHLAAQASNAISFIDPYYDLCANQIGTLNILNFAKDREIKRIIYSSSMSAYGQPSKFPTPENIYMLPESFYAVHKLAGEHYFRIFQKEYGIEYTIFRFYTVYGHGQNLANVNQGLLSIYLSYVINNQPILVKGSKGRIRDIIHVSDVVEAILLSIDSDVAVNKIYNLGSGHSHSIESIINMITFEFGYKAGDYPVIYESGTPGDPFETQADISNTISDLNWHPKIMAFDGIKLTVQSYKNKSK
jgi:UDP-glucose 4-epimerase